MSNPSVRKVISLAVLSFFILPFALISPFVSAQGETTPTPTLSSAVLTLQSIEPYYYVGWPQEDVDFACAPYYNGLRCDFRFEANSSEPVQGSRIVEFTDSRGSGPQTYYIGYDGEANGRFWYDWPNIEPVFYDLSTGSAPATGNGAQHLDTTIELQSYNPRYLIFSVGVDAGVHLWQGTVYIMPQPVIPTPVPPTVTPTVTPTPTYDCSRITLSSIAQAVFAVVGEEQEYCGNLYSSPNSLITLPPGQTAFERFAAVAEDAQHEIDFVTMEWEDAHDDNLTNGNDSPGEMFLRGVKNLYTSVQENSHPGGVRVRILLGLNSKEQRVTVLNDLNRLGIDRVNPAIGWTVEVASYPDDPNSELNWTHSHVKMMIVDGKHLVVAGYNMHYSYLETNPTHDMGLEVRGPIAQQALKVFDKLWLGAQRCNFDPDDFDCMPDSTIESPILHNEDILTPASARNDIVFSLFRDDTDKTADNAIFAAISAADSEVNIIQNRFAPFLDPPFIPLYARAVLDVLQKGNGQVQVNLLVTGGLEYYSINLHGICELQGELLFEDPFGTHALAAKHSTIENPIHTKALSIDRRFVIVGSQNWDSSAWGDDARITDFGDLAEYSLGVDSEAAATDFNTTFLAEWGAAKPTLCAGGSQSSLQAAIDQASPGTAIFIPSGVYRGLINVNKPVVLVGAGANETIFQPQGNQPAFRVTSSDVTIANMKITGGTGYGIELIDSSPSSLKNIQIYRVAFENNAQGGILAQGTISGSPMNYAIENNTFIGGADGITINMIETQTEMSIVRNNIFFGQSNAPVHILSTNDSRVEYTYNLFDDCGLGACTTNWRQGNMSTFSSEHDNLFDKNPLFANAAKGAYQLSSGSPAIDAGDPSLLHEFFYDGDNDETIQIDIGAFEYIPVTNVAPVANGGNDQVISLGSSVASNASYTDADNPENHSARISWGDGMIEDVAVNMTGPGAGEVSGEHTYSSVGSYTVEICVTDLYGGVGCDTVTVEVVSTPTACTPSNAYSSSQSAGAKFASLVASNTTNFKNLPLSFVPNRGQEDQAVRFHAQGLGGRLFFAANEVVFALPNPVTVKEDDKEKIRYDLHPANVVRIHYQGANDNPEVATLEELPGVVNILRGNEPSTWQTNLPTYSGIAYRELYPGIELRYEGTDGQLKSTFYVAPGVDPSAIVWRYKGASDVNIDESGNLVISLPEPAGTGAVLMEQAPIAWQDVNGQRVMVAVEYALDNNDKKVSFLFPYGSDPALPLVIDPTLTYSSYLGGGKMDQANAVTIDADCNVYLSGSTLSLDFPTVNPIQPNQPTTDVFVTKLNTAGTSILYSTYLGGNAADHAWGINRDSQGRITLVGETESSDFPLMNAYDTTYAGGTCEDGDPCDDAFVTQLLADGSALRYSTYLGDTSDEEAYGLALGPDDKINLAGQTRSSTFPTPNGYDTLFGGGTCSGLPCEDVFMAKIDPALSGTASLLYSTFLGGNNYDKAKSIAVDASGHIYITGYTRSDTYPTLNPYQAARASSSDSFITKLNPAVSGSASLLYSTYFGGNSSDHAFGIAVNGANQVYITGFTQSTNFPLANPFDNAFGGGTCGSSACHDAFVTYLNIANNQLVFSSYLGGSHEDEAVGITVDDSGNAYVTGYTKSTNFNTLAAIQASKATDSCSAPPAPMPLSQR
jgi:phosphatidylserine/phosphatidylglycerophosphate/cardiolipin synthase-like enzyme